MLATTDVQLRLAVPGEVTRPDNRACTESGTTDVSMRVQSKVAYMAHCGAGAACVQGGPVVSCCGANDMVSRYLSGCTRREHSMFLGIRLGHLAQSD